MRKTIFTKLVAIHTVAGIAALATAVHAENDEEAPLGKEMEEMGGALKKLRRFKRDPGRWEKSAAAIREGCEHCIKAMPMIPREIEAMPEGPKRRMALADSRRMMGITLALYAELELAFLAEDEKKADELIEKLKDLKVESHEKYNKGE